MNAAVAAPPVIELRPIGSLVPYARNARTHSPFQVSLIAGSIDEFGFTNGVLADAEGIVAGHGRVLGVEQLYAQGKTIRFPNGAPIAPGHIPVVDCSGWTPAQRRAYILADNQIALQAGWNEELLRLEVRELQIEGFDLSILGFGDQLTDLLSPTEPERDPDAVPPVPAIAHSKPGDVWKMGAHRVCCGSGTNPLDWGALMGRELADAVWTDPPYNVNYSGTAGKIKNDSMSNEKFRTFLGEMFACTAAIMKPGAAIYVAHSDTEGLNFREAFTAAGLKLSGCLIWRKDSLVLGRSDFQWQHEPILYGWKPGSKHRWFGGRKQTTVQGWGVADPVSKDADGRWIITAGDRIIVVDGDAKIEAHESTVHFEPKPKRSSEHPTMKPVGLIERHLKNNARAGDLVADGCGGSGSTLVAADRLGMSARLMELDPRFVDVIVQRWQNLTGRTAVHAKTEEEFPK
jgi:DNA modification methylase